MTGSALDRRLKFFCIVQVRIASQQWIKADERFWARYDKMRGRVLVTQSCLTLCDPMDCSPPGSSVHGILQARISEWVAIPSKQHRNSQTMRVVWFLQGPF